jgi:hypothetical protein
MEPRDVYKLLCQGIMGLGHLVHSPESFAAQLRVEYDQVSADDAETLWESVHPDDTLGRLNLRPFKAQGGGIASLTAACLVTARRTWGSKDDLRIAWASFVALCQDGRWPAFSPPNVSGFGTWLEKNYWPVMHHSDRYVRTYRPAYRLLDRELLSELEYPAEKAR